MNNEKKIRNRILIIGSIFYSLISIALVIVFVSIKLNKKPIEPTNPYVKEGVHFYSKDYILAYRLGSPMGTVDVLSPDISYRIDIEKDTYDYNEEFIIRYRLNHFEPQRETGDLKIKFISDNFEFLSPTEYVYKDCKEFNVDLGKADSPVDISLRVKATKVTPSIDNILILLDFDMSEEYKTELIRRHKEDEEERGKNFDFYNDYSYYYNNDFQMMQFIYHINDELGTILIDENNESTIPYEAANYPEQKITIEAFEVAMYQSLNRLYEKNLISKREYVDRIFRNAAWNRPMISPLADELEGAYIYSSNSFRVHFRLEDFARFSGATWNDRAKEIITLVYEEGKITKEEYDTEIALIDSVSVKYSFYPTSDFPSKVLVYFYMYPSLVPFDDYMSFWYDFYIEK